MDRNCYSFFIHFGTNFKRPTNSYNVYLGTYQTHLDVGTI